ncbi:GNAT family N-acetyltransferase [Streptomyces gilvosporeus]|uniref:GNAT family N-acetyltransferase n=1 Tax=Streptomyces gilvosporeus TaxID=553510 RepID=A0A1V0TTK4_9ACTN|nr:GNAT family N-acetyltransferase [Streptomyces gilvosporeus]ARF56213.1 GNAT family N-acetyltransferase [Streptomyces gilvosporeus]
MNFTFAPVIPAGSLCAAVQPSLPSTDGELVLRPWAEDDAAVVLSAYEDPVIRRWHTRHLATLEEARERIAAHGRGWREERVAEWAVTGAVGGEVLGRVALRWMDLQRGLAECAYWVLPHARGKGVAPRALATVADWALDEVGFHRLELVHSDRNEASCRVATKAGFAGEGVRRSAHLHEDGWHDMHLHGRVQGDG